MPYYLFKITQSSEMEMIKHLELVDQFDAFKDAKNEAKQRRIDNNEDKHVYKVMFADNQLQAEEQLQETREKPVLMEYER
ncbi:MAG: hypothetical protein ACI9LO_000611 [Planctomycetota bacterium]|jgi:hypothetical protein